MNQENSQQMHIQYDTFIRPVKHRGSGRTTFQLSFEGRQRIIEFIDANGFITDNGVDWQKWNRFRTQEANYISTYTELTPERRFRQLRLLSIEKRLVSLEENRLSEIIAVTEKDEISKEAEVLKERFSNKNKAMAERAIIKKRLAQALVPIEKQIQTTVDNVLIEESTRAIDKIVLPPGLDPKLLLHLTRDQVYRKIFVEGMDDFSGAITDLPEISKTVVKNNCAKLWLTRLTEKIEQSGVAVFKELSEEIYKTLFVDLLKDDFIALINKIGDGDFPLNSSSSELNDVDRARLQIEALELLYTSKWLNHDQRKVVLDKIESKKIVLGWGQRGIRERIDAKLLHVFGYLKKCISKQMHIEPVNPEIIAKRVQEQTSDRRSAIDQLENKLFGSLAKRLKKYSEPGQELFNRRGRLAFTGLRIAGLFFSGSSGLGLGIFANELIAKHGGYEGIADTLSHTLDFHQNSFEDGQLHDAHKIILHPSDLAASSFQFQNFEQLDVEDEQIQNSNLPVKNDSDWLIRETDEFEPLVPEITIGKNELSRGAQSTSADVSDVIVEQKNSSFFLELISGNTPDANLTIEQDYVPPNLVAVENYGIEAINDAAVREEVIPHLQSFADAAKKMGYTIGVTYGYRSYDLQAKIAESNPDGAAKPGQSQHQSGFAVDLYIFRDSRVVAELSDELIDLAAEYGFVRTLAWDRPHFVCVDAMEENGVSLLQQNGLDPNPDNPHDYSIHNRMNKLIEFKIMTEASVIKQGQHP